MNGELQESVLMEKILLIFMSALWGQHPRFPHPESPQDTGSCGHDFPQQPLFIGEAGILPEPHLSRGRGVSSCPPISHSLSCPGPALKLPPQSSPLSLLLESESSP